MQFSILIPTLNNLDYLKLCLNSLKKNSVYDHEILVHSNNSSDGTSDFLKLHNIKEIKTKDNFGLCTALNQLASHASNDYFLFLHDDMYICPNWDQILIDEINQYDHNNFYLSGVMIEKTNGHINYNFGENFENFDEKSFLSLFDKFPLHDIQGTDKNPSLVHRSLWNKVNGMSEEFNPGDASDPDFILKLWNSNVRIFKGISAFRVYHFGSITTRKNKNIKLNNGSKTFLNKWGITYKFFRKHYLNYHSKFDGPLNNPKKNLIYFFDLMICKIKFYGNKIFRL
tara:strand:- start:495 stop:1346 length:852 start_codon:yes stop_codon:yes gene_type:complete